MTLHEKIQQYLETIGTPASGVVNIDKKNNKAGMLFNTFCWQEISNIAKQKLEQSWKTLEEEEVLATDEDLRSMGKGEHIVVESSVLSCIIKVSAPRGNLDKDLFITTLARKLKVSKDRIEEIAEACTKDGKAPLQKRILEA